MTAYIIALATSASFYVLLALGLNLQWGMAGLVNFGVAGFYALGAYAAALAAERAGLHPVLAFAAALLAGAAAGLLLAALAARLREDYLAIATLGFAEVVRLVALNEDWLTRGARGMQLSTRLFPADWGRGEVALATLALGAAACLAAFLLLSLLARGAFGRLLRAVREDSLVPASLGRDPNRLRLRALAIGGAIMGGAGALYAGWVLSISPDHFHTSVTVVTWMAVVAGGAGRNLGVVLGAVLVLVVFEGTRFLGGVLPGLDAERLGALRLLLVGVLLILAIRLRPAGLLPERIPSPPPRPEGPSP